jgi:hypothetical protein
MAQTGKMQTYQDAIEAMLNRSVILPTELLAEIENFIEENKRLGFMTREEFIRDAARLLNTSQTWCFAFLFLSSLIRGGKRKD